MSANDTDNPSGDDLPEEEESAPTTEPVPSSDGNDEEIIDLTEEVPSDKENGDEIIDLTHEVPSNGENGEEIIDLTEEVPSEKENGDGIIDLTDEVPQSGENGAEIVDLTDLDDDDTGSDDEVVSGALPGTAGFSLSPEKIDRALEKTVEKLYGQRIENLLVDVVQRKVSAEIEKIKKSLRSG